ncbi:hypothetical protein, partial [Arthrobacter sp. ZGTC131]|uniref:hypothetical protein n=1 Tax=Arthrobacter sp. ZGTC131 TaxID=2058898 RepID=UPI001CA4935C
IKSTQCLLFRRTGVLRRRIAVHFPMLSTLLAAWFFRGSTVRKGVHRPLHLNWNRQPDIRQPRMP